MLIDTRLAERIKQVSPSSTLTITSKAKKLKSEGKDIVTLAAGEPDFDTPDYIKDAAVEAIKQGFTKYTPTTGTLELKDAVCRKFKRDNSLDYSPNQIIVSCGAKHSIFNTLAVLLNKDDEVLILSPYWVSYPEMVKFFEGKPRFIKTQAANNFKFTIADLKRNLTKKAKVLILNSPSNPCGSVYDEAELKTIAELCVKNKTYVISDEIYEKIIYDNRRHLSIASLSKEIYELTVTVNGLSKSHSMTGWRIGYLGAPAYIAESISKLQDHSTSNPTSIAQKAGLAALNGSEEFPDMMRREFQKRRDYLVERFKNIKKMTCVVPQGAFYIFCGIKDTGLDSAAFASRLLDESLVALIPGESFGNDDYVRISFAAGMEQLKKGMDRIEEWIAKL